MMEANVSSISSPDISHAHKKSSGAGGPKHTRPRQDCWKSYNGAGITQAASRAIVVVSARFAALTSFRFPN